MSIKIISALSSNRVIGYDGKIPWFIKGELKRFKELTLNHNVVMGRKTFDSIGKTLEQRNNIIISNMVDLIRSENINSSIVYDLFDGIESDIKANVKIKSYKELLIYCYRVAGTVGLMMAKIMKVKNRDSLKSAINLGIAMQLTNISRDVIEDKNNDREYIESNFLILKNTIHKADNFYESSFYAIKDIPLICRFSIIVARRVYRQI